MLTREKRTQQAIETGEYRIMQRRQLFVVEKRKVRTTKVKDSDHQEEKEDKENYNYYQIIESKFVAYVGALKELEKLLGVELEQAGELATGPTYEAPTHTGPVVLDGKILIPGTEDFKDYEKMLAKRAKDQAALEKRLELEAKRATKDKVTSDDNT